MTTDTSNELDEFCDLLGLPRDIADEEIFVQAHHKYHQSDPKVDREYGVKHYQEFLKDGKLPFYMKRLRDLAREDANLQ